jgi:ureidoacrylate peracid hydrolase
LSLKKRLVKIEAKPESIEVDTARTAIVVIDMQNDFGAKGGMFDRVGIDISMIQKAVEPIRRVLMAGRRERIKIIYVNMQHSADLSDAGAPDSPHRIKHIHKLLGKKVKAPNGREGRILVQDTWNTEVLPELAPKDGDIIIAKHRYSGFYNTNLDSVLKTLGVKYLIVTGCTTSVCVESTIRDAMFRDYSCILLEDCTGEPVGYGLPRSNHEASLLLIQCLFGWVSDSEKFTKALSR